MNKNIEVASELKQIVFQKYKRCLVYAFVFSAFINVLMLTPSLYMLQLYGRVVTARSVETLVMLTLLVTFLFAAMAALEILRARLLIVFSNKLDLALSNRLYDAIFKLSTKAPGRVSSQAMSDLNTIKQYMSANGIFAFLDSPWMILYIAVLFMFHPWFGYFGIFSICFLFVLAIFNEKATDEGLRESNESYKKQMNFIDLNLRNSEAISAMGMNKNLKKIWNTKHDEFLDAHSEASVKAGFYTHLSKACRTAFQSFILGLGAYLVVKMEVNPGMMIAGSIVLGRALAPLDILIGSWRSFKSAKESYQRLDKFLIDFPVEAPKLQLPDPNGFLALDSISLVPPGSRHQALFGISFALNAGEMCAIIGPSAAGKSSLARASLGIWPIFNGVVRIDGADVTHYNSDHLGDFIGYLPQDVELFEGTVAQNISRFGELDSKEIIRAARAANVHEMILNLPDGYETKLGHGGLALSGGQRQRVALARAFYKSPKLIVLDEPNASLDEAGEQALLEAMMAMKGKATIVLITHKLSILKAVDKIAVLNAGRLTYFGEKNAVLEKLGVIKPQKLQRAKKQINVSLDDGEEG